MQRASLQEDAKVLQDHMEERYQNIAASMRDVQVKRIEVIFIISFHKLRKSEDLLNVNVSVAR